MEFLGIGPLEFLLIALIAFLILGPKELQKTGKSIGKGLNKLIKSDTWKSVQQASDKVRSLPNELIREAGIEELQQSLKTSQILPSNKVQRPDNTLDGYPGISNSTSLDKKISDNSTAKKKKPMDKQ
jgi:Sec-independent protein translocase protein TatA